MGLAKLHCGATPPSVMLLSRVLKTIIESNAGYVPGCGKEAVVTLKIFELNCEDVGRVVR